MPWLIVFVADMVLPEAVNVSLLAFPNWFI